MENVKSTSESLSDKKITARQSTEQFSIDLFKNSSTGKLTAKIGLKNLAFGLQKKPKIEKFSLVTSRQWPPKI